MMEEEGIVEKVRRYSSVAVPMVVGVNDLSFRRWASGIVQDLQIVNVRDDQRPAS